MYKKPIRIALFLFLINFTSLSMAASVYFAEIDPNQSSGHIGFFAENAFQLSGTIKITIDNNTIQFENIDIESSPSYNIHDMILSNAGTYDGQYFEYYFCDYCLGNGYWGEFNGESLSLSGITYGLEPIDYTIFSSDITSVPLPSGFLLMLSGLALLTSRLKKS